MIIVNEAYEIEGSFSFDINIDRSKKPAIVSIEGALETKVYIEDLKSLRNERYALMNIEVWRGKKRIAYQGWRVFFQTLI